MTNAEKFGLWNFEIISQVNDHMNLVRNKNTNALMMHIVMPDDMFDIMRSLSQVSNPHIMQVYDTIRNDGKCFSLCEYVDGITLEKYVAGTGHLDEKEAKRILIQVCDGLSVLHSHGIIHRDINPSNVMIAGGCVKIIDYNIVRTYKGGQAKDTIIMGTPGYTSPEQFGFNQTDAGADIYSCGVLLSYLLTGALPNEVSYRGSLKDIIVRCTEIDREKRFKNINELRTALSKRHYMYGRFLPLPGFRGNHLLPKILTTLFLLFYGFVLMIAIVSEIKDGQSSLNIYDYFIFFGWWSLFPYILWGDFGRLSEIICKRNPKAGKGFLVFLGFVSILIGFFFITLSQSV